MTEVNHVFEKTKLDLIKEPSSEDLSVLYMDKNQISSLTKRECDHHVYFLSLYSAYIKMTFNKANSELTVAESAMSMLISKHKKEYDKFDKWEYVRSDLSANNEDGKRIAKKIEELKILTNDLYDMDKKIDRIADSIRSVGFSR